MLNKDKRKVIVSLFEEGRKKKEIARLLNITPQTVRRILVMGADRTIVPRTDKKSIDLDLLRRLYARCDGYIQRMYELLNEDEKIEKIGYSTLTRLIRENGIGQENPERCHQVPDLPGEEMQHDTTVYNLKLGTISRKVICSALYLRYSKMRYIKFYPVFNRFLMKCFFYEALTFWGYTAKNCVIDNTNLAILHGTGQAATINPEMVVFARPLGFEWLAHEKGHANRKAGKERNFWTIETNFLPGRFFQSIEDLNRQGLEWATVKYAQRPLSKTHLIPVSLFEEEKTYLLKLPAYIEPPSIPHKRDIDEYGYIAFNANYYWIPGKGRGTVSIIEYPDRLKIFSPGQEAIEYLLPAWGTRNNKFTPPGAKTNPYEPKNIKKTCDEEEKRLRTKGEIYSRYLDFIKSNRSGIKQKPKLIRQLYLFSKKIAPDLFAQTIARALKFHISNIETIMRIAEQFLHKDFYQEPELFPNNDYEKRESYQKGRWSKEVAPDYYQKLLDEKEKDTKDKE